MHNSKEIIYRVSALLIVLSALLYLIIPVVASWIMSVSVIALSVITALTPYPGDSIRGRRLYGFQIISCLFMSVAAYLMFKNNNLWPLAMMVGAVFLLYSSIVMPKEYEREKNSRKDEPY